MIVSHVIDSHRPRPIRAQVNRAFDRISSFVLAFAAAFAVTMNVVIDSFHAARLGAVMGLLIVLHTLKFARLAFGREAMLYVCFVGYICIALLWTDDVGLAMNTLVPAIAFVLVMAIFGSLATYHDLRTVVSGALVGILISAVAYTMSTGFPFTYPPEFSYNAIAGIYLCGLFVVSLYACFGRSRAISFSLAVVFYALLVATTSIKFNLGVLLGLTTAAFLYFGHFWEALRKNVVPLLVLVAVLGYVAATNDALWGVVQPGLDRVGIGIEILQARENVPGYSSFESRQRWHADGFKGWWQNPLFGNGVEAFRDRYGSTSHSTPVDVLYNFGLIGFVLFYALFASTVVRLFRMRRSSWGAVHAVIFGALICYLFVSLSAPLHYNAFFAVFVAISTAVLSRQARSGSDAAARMTASG